MMAGTRENCSSRDVWIGGSRWPAESKMSEVDAGVILERYLGR